MIFRYCSGATRIYYVPQTYSGNGRNLYRRQSARFRKNGAIYGQQRREVICSSRVSVKTISVCHSFKLEVRQLGSRTLASRFDMV